MIYSQGVSRPAPHKKFWTVRTTGGFVRLIPLREDALTTDQRNFRALRQIDEGGFFQQQGAARLDRDGDFKDWVMTITK